MQKRLTHQMKIKELDLVLELICQYIEFFQSQTMLGPIRFGTELAIKVAYIRYFKVASGYHVTLFFIHNTNVQILFDKFFFLGFNAFLKHTKPPYYYCTFLLPQTKLVTEKHYLCINLKL